MTLHNYTGHRFTILTPDGQVDLQPEGEAQVVNVTERAGVMMVDGKPVPTYVLEEGLVEGLPPQRDGETYIVSWPVARFLNKRSDLYVGYKPYIRNQQTLGVRALAQLTHTDEEVKLNGQ